MGALRRRPRAPAAEQPRRRRQPAAATVDDAAFSAVLSRLRHRLVAWCFLVAHTSLALDMDVMVGDDGLWPARQEFVRRATDFDARAQLLYFPSLLGLLGVSLPTLKAVAIVGSMAAASCVLRPGWRAIAVAWISYQAFSIVGGLVLWMPWDGMLLEAGMLCALTPDASAPPAEVDLGFRWLAFRVLIGFGKHKFLPPALDAAKYYVRDFLLSQPLPLLAGWSLVHRLLTNFPLLSLGCTAFLFMCEVLGPPCLLLKPCLVQRFVARSVIVLMVGISPCGNFGWFNLLTIACVLPAAFRLSQRPSPSTTRVSYGQRLRRLFLALWALLSLPFIAPSQWCSPGILYWQPVDDAFGSTATLTLLRVASSWRLVHTYGVFPPRLPPLATHAVPMWELSRDGGASWSRLEYEFRHTAAYGRGRPSLGCLGFLRFPRFDYLAWYDASRVIFTPDTSISPNVALKSAFSHRHRIAWALLSNSSPIARRLQQQPSGVPRHAPPATHVRAWTVELVPLHAAKDFERASGTRLRCGTWSCMSPNRMPLLKPATLEQLRATFGDAPHSDHLPTPLEYGDHSHGYAGLARRPDPSTRAAPRPRPEDDDWPGPGSFSCLFADHLIPRRYHPSSCSQHRPQRRELTA